MTKHARNNCASSVFTYAERRKIRHWGTQAQRLGAESMKPFSACAICLQEAQTPMVCEDGHLYCKACIYESLLTQKEQAKRALEQYEQSVRDEQARKADAASARERERVQEFLELDAQVDRRSAKRAKLLSTEQPATSSTSSSSTSSSPSPATSSAAGAAPLLTSALTSQSSLGYERVRGSHGDAFVVDKDVVRDLSAARLTPDQLARKKQMLPSFWLPSMTPEADTAVVAKPTMQTVCPEGNHPLRLKQLHVVRFTANTGVSVAAPAASSSSSSSSSSGARFMCPCCRRALNNNVAMYCVLACGEVLCHVCVDTLMREEPEARKDGEDSAEAEADAGAKQTSKRERERPQRSSIVCGSCSVQVSRAQLVRLQAGNGYAASGARVATAHVRPAFQC